MSQTENSLGSMLQGASQQAARLRLEGQVTEQVNMISDVTIGLGSRPASDEIATLGNVADGTNVDFVSIEGETYTIGTNAASGAILMWRLDGSPVTVNLNTSTSYIGDDMRFHVVRWRDEKYIVCLNRDTIAEVDPTPVGRAFEAGLFFALGGQFSKTYSVTVTTNTGSHTSTYTTPDGSNPGDAAQTSSTYIVTQLANDLAANAGAIGATVQRSGDVCKIRVAAGGSVSIGTEDGEGGEILRKTTSSADSVTDLPRYAPNGMIVKIIGDAADEDDFYLKFNAKGSTANDGNGGFGLEGVWEETFNPDEPSNFNLSTMPHVLKVNGSGFDWEQGPWLGRSVGDELSAPFPSFINKRIRDLNSFESAFMCISPNTVVTSRENEPFDFFRETATTRLETDPKDFTSTKKDDLQLSFLVPMDRDMIVVEDPGEAQFVIRGGSLTTDNASMVLTTQFEVNSNNTPPVNTGRTVLLPFNTGRYSGVNEFFTDSDVAANTANNLTKDVNRFIDGKIDQMEISQNLGMCVISASAKSNVMYIYQYLWDGTDLLQSAWHIWNTVDEIIRFFFVQSKLYVVSKDSTGLWYMHSINMDRPDGEYGYHLTLDRKQSVSINFEPPGPGQAFNDKQSGYIELPYPTARFQQGQGCAFPGSEAVPLLVVKVGTNTWRYIFDRNIVPPLAELTAGQTVPWSLTPTRPFATNFQGGNDTTKEVIVQDYFLAVVDSGPVGYRISRTFSDTSEYEDSRFPLDDDLTDPDRLGLWSGELEIPFGEDVEHSELTLFGNNIRPVTLHELRWAGHVFNKRG